LDLLGRRTRVDLLSKPSAKQRLQLRVDLGRCLDHGCFDHFVVLEVCLGRELGCLRAVARGNQIADLV
jgi:hypothetical protein